MKGQQTMKTTNQFTLTALFAASLALPAFAQQTVNTPSGKLEFEKGYPSKDTVAKPTFGLGPAQLTSEDRKVILLAILILALPAMGQQQVPERRGSSVIDETR
jgi:hypothetical protein